MHQNPVILVLRLTFTGIQMKKRYFSSPSQHWSFEEKWQQITKKNYYVGHKGSGKVPSTCKCLK